MNENANANENQTKKLTAQEILSGEFLTRDWFRHQYNLFILIGALVFMYIFLGFQAQRQQHKLSGLQKEWQTKHFEQLTVEAELTERTRQSTIIRDLNAQNSNLKTNTRPVIRLH